MEIEDLRNPTFKRGKGYTIDSVEAWKVAVLDKLDELLISQGTAEIKATGTQDWTKILFSIGPDGLTRMGYQAIGLTLHQATLYARNQMEKTNAEIASYKNEVRHWAQSTLKDMNQANLEQLKLALAKMVQELS